MKLQYKTSILAIALCMLMSGQALAQANLVADFENTPLFSEVNFTPGDNINRWIRVNNNSGQAQEVIIEAIKVSDIDDFSQSMNLQILNGPNILFNDTLKTFFNSGEVILGGVTDQGLEQYDLSITFLPDFGNDYQALSLSFDILIGFVGTEDQATDGAGTGGGATVLPGLSMLSETVTVIDVLQDSVTITWNTSYLSTSQVVYAKEGESHILDTSAVNFGYERSYPNPENFNKVTGHSVTIPNLAPGTTYNFRCISHASPATISKEFSFVTTGDSIPDQGNEKPIIPTIPIIQPESTITESQIIGELEDSIIDIPIQEDEELEEVAINQDSVSNNGMLAAIGNILDYKFLGPILLLSLLIIVAFTVGKVIIWFIRRKK